MLLLIFKSLVISSKISYSRKYISLIKHHYIGHDDVYTYSIFTKSGERNSFLEIKGRQHTLTCSCIARKEVMVLIFVILFFFIILTVFTSKYNYM